MSKWLRGRSLISFFGLFALGEGKFATAASTACWTLASNCAATAMRSSRASSAIDLASRATAAFTAFSITVESQYLPWYRRGQFPRPWYSLLRLQP